MGLLGSMRIASKVGRATFYHLTYQAVADPQRSREFVRTLCNTIVDFDKGTDSHLPWIRLHLLCPGIESIELSPKVSFPEGFELPMTEYLCLAGMVCYFKPKVVFEVGTYKGRTTRLFAEMTGPNTRIYTLDLPPKMMTMGGYFSEEKAEQIGEEFSHSPYRSKITQFYGDSRSFDFSPFHRMADFVFVDGNHDYEFVRTDTEHALQMIKPGGTIVWDDCHPIFTPGVVRCLEELSVARRIRRIAGTRLACYRAEESDVRI